jgi:hypothetical protein
MDNIKINAYKVLEEPRKVFVVKNFDNYTEYFENSIIYKTKNEIIYLGKKSLLDDRKLEYTTKPFKELRKYQKIGLFKKAFEIFCRTLDFKYIKQGVLLRNDIAKKVKVNNAYILFGLAYRIEVIMNKFSIVIAPKNIISPDGENYNAKFAHEMSSLLIDTLAIKYSDYLSRYNDLVKIIGNSFNIDLFECGNIIIEISNTINSNKLSIYQEPKISFGGGKEHTFPSSGLKRFHPLDYNESTHDRPEIIECAYIGTEKDVCKKLLKNLMKGSIPFSKIYKSKLTFLKDCSNILTPLEISTCCNTIDVVNLLKSKAKKIRQSKSNIKLCLIELPTEWDKFFIGQEKDLHDMIKVTFFNERIPTQIITKNAVQSTNQSVYDNLRLGIYVTAGGKPWKLVDQFNSTAYIGITFGKVIDNKKRLIGIAEIYDEYGQTICFKCVAIKEYDLDAFIEDKDYHLSFEMMQSITLTLINEYYESHKDNWPKRVVIHKTSSYNSDEKDALEIFKEHPFSVNCIYIHSKNSYLWNLITNGPEPNRGTYFQFDEKKALLYTSGILQEQKKYIMTGMPSPLLIEDQSENKNISLACEEILKLTKLNWNSINTYERYPITISHAKKIIQLMRVGLTMDDTSPMDLRFFL